MAEQFRYRDLINPLLTIREDKLRDRVPTIHNALDDRAWGRAWGADRERYAREENAELDRQSKELLAIRRRSQEARVERERAIAANPNGPFEWPRQDGGGQRYHINGEGKALPCRAQARACPYGVEDHFSMPATYTPIESQTVAEWLLERKYSTVPFLLKDGSVGAEDVRRLGAKLSRAAAVKQPNQIEIDLEVSLLDLKPIRVARRVGNTYDNRWQSHAYWVLDDGRELNRFFADRVSEDNLGEFITRYAAVAYGDQDPDVRRELEAELHHRITSLMVAAEGEASLITPGSVHYSPVPLGFDLGVGKNEEGEWEGAVNYATTALRPAHFRTLNSNYEDQPSEEPVVFASGFEVYDNDAGRGRGSWSLLRTDEGWTITVQGSRGDLETFTVSDPDEAEERFARVYARRVSGKNAERARYRADLYSEDMDRRASIEDRARFVRAMVEEDIRGRRLRGEH